MKPKSENNIHRHCGLDPQSPENCLNHDFSKIFKMSRINKKICENLFNLRYLRAKKHLTILLFFFIALNNLYSQQWEYITIKGDLQSGDTVFLVNEWRISYYKGDTFISRNAIYIEPNKSSEYYNRLGDFSLSKDYEEKEYYIYSTDSTGEGELLNIENRFYVYDENFDLKEVSVTLKKKNIPQNLSTKWVPLYLYNNKYYLYAPCEWTIPKYNITDTLLMYYGWMDGLYGFSYDTIIQKSNNHYSIQNIKGFHNTEINIYIIDKAKGIAVFEFDNYKPSLYVDAEKIRNFPIIVCECTEKYEEYKFPDIDIKKLIKKSKGCKPYISSVGQRPAGEQPIEPNKSTKSKFRQK